MTEVGGVRNGEDSAAADGGSVDRTGGGTGEREDGSEGATQATIEENGSQDGLEGWNCLGGEHGDEVVQCRR